MSCNFSGQFYFADDFRFNGFYQAWFWNRQCRNEEIRSMERNIGNEEKEKRFKWKYYEEEKGNGRTWQQCEKKLWCDYSWLVNVIT